MHRGMTIPVLIEWFVLEGLSPSCFLYIPLEVVFVVGDNGMGQILLSEGATMKKQHQRNSHGGTKGQA